jgi:outer membrane assembly lipoprotein YfiO
MPETKRVGSLWIAALVLAFCLPAAAQWTWTPQTGRWVNVKRLPKETPELQIEYARSLMLEGKYERALRETSKFKQFYADSPLADQNQFLRGEIYLKQGKYTEAAKEFQALVTSYPNTSLYEEATRKQYEIGDTLYAEGLKKIERRWAFFKKRPLKRAAEVYGMVVSNQPFMPQAAEAQYKIGLCRMARRDYLEATYEYKRVLEDYPDSPWVDDAMHDLALAYYRMALPPAYDQTPSRMAVETVADFEERYPNDERLGELKDKQKTMQERIAQQRLMTAQYYEKRHRFQAARIYYELVANDFADTQAAEKAKQWLQENPNVGIHPLVAQQKAGS